MILHQRRPFASKKSIDRLGEQSSLPYVKETVVRRRIELMNFRVQSLVFGLAVVATPALAAESPATPVQQEKHFEAKIAVTAKLDYLLFLPEGYGKLQTALAAHAVPARLG